MTNPDMTEPDFAERWRAIKRRAADLSACDDRLGFVKSWDAGNPFDAAAPPASEAEVRAVERAIGRPLPASLRQVFREATAAVAFGWHLPRRLVQMPLGYTDGIWEVVPPPPFQEKSNMGGLPNLQPMVPKISSGGLSLALDALPDLAKSAQMWARSFDKAAADERDDESLRLHYLGFRDMWRRNFPFAEVGNGDQMGIDTEHPDAHVIVTNHEGADYPAWSLGRPLLEQIEQASRLGFIGLLGFNPFFGNALFADPARNHALEAASAAERPHEAALGLRLIEAVAIDAECPNARLWRAWLGLPEAARPGVLH